MTPLLLLDTAEQAFGFAAVVIAVIGGTTSFVVALRRQGKMLAAMYDAVMGQEEVRDRSGAAIRESQPGLAAMQRLMGSQVEGVDRKVDALVQLPQRVSALESRIDDHATRIITLETGAVERIVTRAESMQHLHTVERALDSQPPTDEKKP